MSNIKIQDMVLSERPYEKVEKYGVQYLSDAELIAILLRTGTTKHNVIELSQLILNLHSVYKGISGLNYLTMKDLTNVNGIGTAKACQILAICELSKRLASACFKSEIYYNSPASIAAYFMEKVRYLTKERMYALFFNSSNALIKEVMISEGTVNVSLASPREIFIEALKYEAVNFVLIHNHPSGNPEPSNQDIAVTQKIRSMGEMLEIALLDHIILGDNKYISLLERGLL